MADFEPDNQMDEFEDKMVDFEPDIQMDEFENQIDDTTGAVGGVAETDFGGRLIQTEAEVHQRGQRGSAPPEEAVISADDRNSIEGLTQRLAKLRSEEEKNPGSQQGAITAIKRQRAELAKNMFYSYVEKLGYKIEKNELAEEATFHVDKNGSIWAHYGNKNQNLTRGSLDSFYKLSTISQKAGTKFIRIGLGIKDFGRTSGV